MFRSCPFNQDITGWNMSAVNDLSWMFADNSNFNQNISTWQIRTTGNINFESMFRNATSFNKNISNWNTSAVSNMIEMFIGATSFNQDLSSWNINSLIDATNMFANTNLSTANYDALLIGWESQKPNIQQDVALGVGSTQYTLGGAAETARNNLIDPLQFNWTITDGGGI
jgi:surface protein